MADSGYKGWTELPLDKDEQEIADSLEKTLHSQMQLCGMSEEDAQSIRFAFKKATLTIDAEEARSGAHHSLADGQPFYTLMISSDNDLEGKDGPYSVQTLFMMAASQLYSPSSLGLRPLSIQFDFRHSDKNGALQLAHETGATMARVAQAVRAVVKPS